MTLFEALDNRNIRTDSQGLKWEYSDSQGQPSGEGWRRVDRVKHPRATRFLWVRPYSATRKSSTTAGRPDRLVKTEDIKLEPVSSDLLGNLDISIHNYLSDFRKKLRDGMKDSVPFYAGDRVRLKADDKNYYVSRVDRGAGKLYLHNALDKNDEKVVSNGEVEGDFERKNTFWTTNDNVILSPDATGGKGATEGEVVGFDETTSKVRILITGGKEVSVYPEAIVGLKGANASNLKKTEAYLDKNEHVLADQDSKYIMEALLRASLQNRSSVGMEEIWDDINANTGRKLSKSLLRSKLASIEDVLGSEQHKGFIFNAMSDRAFIADSRLGIRLLANKRGVKGSRRLFGWKNILDARGGEEYAHSNQKILLKTPMKDSFGNSFSHGKITKIMGNKATVAVGGTTRVLHLGELQGLNGNNLLPDPLDPQAYGAVNRNAFWLLKDREWAKDFKINDTVSLLSMVENPSGKQANYGAFGVVMDHTTDGRVAVKMASGKEIYVSPRQLKQIREVGSANQFLDKVEQNATHVYGSTTIIGDAKGAKARVSVGGQRDNKFLHLNFTNGKDYKKVESQLFTTITDNKATQNQNRAIIAANTEDFEDAGTQTLVPNAHMMQAIRKLYPNAKTFMIRREMRVLPGRKTSFNTPNSFERSVKYTPDEVRELVANGEHPKGGEYFEPSNIQKGAKKVTKGDKKFYEPDKFIRDMDTGEITVKGEGLSSPYNPLSKLSYLNPFGSDHKVERNRSYSGAKIEGDYDHIPVKISIIIDPKEGQIRKTFNGIVHDIPYVLRQNSAWAKIEDRPSSAVKNEDVNWNNKLQLSIEGNKLHLAVGSDISKMTSKSFIGPDGQPMSLKNVLMMPQEMQYELWSHLPNFRNLLDKTSLFTYDRANKRFTSTVTNYTKAHQFLKMFMGNNHYEAHTFEDFDGSFSTRAGEQKLFKTYRKALDDMQNSFIKNAEKATESASKTGMSAINRGFLDHKFRTVGREYQKEALNFLLSRPYSLLANDQGTGKTPLMLGAIIGRMNRGEVRRALVIAPATVAQNTWPGETEKWCKDGASVRRIEKSKSLTDEQKKIAIAKLPLSVKPMQLNSKTKEKFFSEILNSDEPIIASCGYEMARLYGKELQQIGFDMVCLDEAQHIKTGKSKGIIGSKQTQIIKEVFADTPFKIAASGTPIENKAQDLHSIVDWLDPSLFGSADDFMNNFVVTDYLNVGGKKKLVNIAIKNAQELDNRLATVMTRTSKNWMAADEQKAIKAQLEAKGINFNKVLHYGQVSPRLEFPLVSNKVNLETGRVEYLDLQGNKTPFVSELESYGENKDNLLKPIDLSTKVNKNKYKEYIAAVDAVNNHVVSQLKNMYQTRQTRYGNVNTAASTAFIKMQKVLNDPYLLSSDPEFGGVAVFNNPDIPNPKYDRLTDILKQHDTLPFDKRTKDLVLASPLNQMEKGQKRYDALHTRGKTIIFAENTTAMGALKARLDNDPQFRGRIAIYAGTGKTAELSGKSGSGRKIRDKSLHDIRNDSNVDILIANSAAETGLNIPQADLVLNYELPWNPQVKNQRIDRAHRIGSQPRPVTAINIFVTNSVEEKKIRAHVVKNQLFNAIMTRRERAQQLRKKGITANIKQESLDPEYLRKSVAYMGDDKNKLMQEMINTDPQMQRIEAATDVDMMRSLQAKSIRKNAKRSRKKRVTATKKRSLVRRMFGF